MTRKLLREGSQAGKYCIFLARVCSREAASDHRRPPPTIIRMNERSKPCGACRSAVAFRPTLNRVFDELLKHERSSRLVIGMIIAVRESSLNRHRNRQSIRHKISLNQLLKTVSAAFFPYQTGK